MIIVTVHYKALPGKREAFVKKLFDDGLAQASKAEAGNICYDYYFSAEDENEVLLLEKWKDQEALDIHGKTAHYAALGIVKEGYLESTVIESYDSEKR